MRRMKKIVSIALIIILCSFFVRGNEVNAINSNCQIDLDQIEQEKIDNLVNDILRDSKVPGVSIAIVNNEQTKFLNYGKADIKNNIDVSCNTYFELGSMSKAFTALAILLLEDQNQLSLEDKVTDYLPWFHVSYDGENDGVAVNGEVDLSLKDLLYHTSGIPYNTIGFIPEGTSADMLEVTVRGVSGTYLDYYPGNRFQYSTLNYDILGLIIEKISNISYEKYIEKNILEPLNLTHTYLFKQDVFDNGNLAKGYKMEFFKAVEYDAPYYRGNTPAGYIYSNAEDMVKWARIQLGLMDVPENYARIINKSHQGNMSVASDSFYYGGGWYIDIKGTKIYHGGSNPNYSSMLVLKPNNNLGICVLTNMDSNVANYLADNIINIIQQKSVCRYLVDSYQSLDSIFSIVTILSILAIITYCVLIVKVFHELLHKKRMKNVKNVISERVRIIFILPIVAFFCFCIYYLPNIILYRMPWKAVNVWGSSTIMLGSVLCLIAFIIFSCYVVLSYNFPKKKEKNYFAVVPLCLMNGICSALIIFTINESFNRNLEYSKELLIYFLFSITFFVYTIKLYQGKMIDIANEITYEKRMKIIDKIMGSTYQKIETIGRERIFSGINNDCNTIAQFPGIIVSFASNLLTVIICMIYLYEKSIETFLIALVIILINGVLSFISGRKTTADWEKNRDIQDTFFGQIHDLVNGFKELVLYKPRRVEFWKDIEHYSKLSNEVNKKASKQVLLFNLFSAFTYNLVFGFIVFVFPIIDKNIKLEELRENLIIIFYIIGPFRAFVNAIPQLFQVNVNISRINGLVKELESCQDNQDSKIERTSLPPSIILRLDNVRYQYTIRKNNILEFDKEFEIGPISLEFRSNEITFITGSNGSGKSTLGKLVTGLYSPTSGKIRINDQEADCLSLNELFSSVYSDFNLFKKLYGFDFKQSESQFKDYIEMMNLESEIQINDSGEFESLNLSTGQKKRLAFIISCLENKPLLLFDEWAAEQDPEFRNYFYTQLLPMLKKQGKGVIVITHDDRYFNMGDRLVVLERGKIIKAVSI